MHHHTHEQVGDLKKGMKINHGLGVSDTDKNSVSAIMNNLIQQVQQTRPFRWRKQPVIRLRSLQHSKDGMFD